MFFLGVVSKAAKTPYGGPCKSALPLPLVELLLQGLFPQRKPHSSKMCLMGKSPNTRETEGWLTDVTTVKETCPVAAELSQTHRSCGELQQ